MQSLATDYDAVYHVNSRDEICYVNADYEAFALANPDDNTVAAAVLHHSLWEFIADATTQEIYRKALKRVRAGRPFRFSIRCDAAEFRRRLQIRMHAVDHGMVEFRVNLLAEERRPAVALLSRAAIRSDQMLLACGWCNRFEVDGQWEEVEVAVNRLRLFEQPVLPAVTHGVCAACHDAMLAAIEAA
jgi:hypothetical protein